MKTWPKVTRNRAIAKIGRMVAIPALSALAYFGLVQSASASGTATDVPGCGSLLAPNRAPPMDYRNDRRMLDVVERHHFGPKVEALVQPMFSSFGQDLDFTLHAFPNHTRALVTLVRLAERERNIQPKGSPYTVECYFLRAIHFAPDDGVVRMLFAQYLSSLKRRDDALTQLRFVASIAGDNPLTHYNLGLLYLELSERDKAKLHAQRAAELGFPRRELLDRLSDSSTTPQAQVLDRSPSQGSTVAPPSMNGATEP